MAELRFYDFGKTFQDAADAGQQRAKTNKLASLYQQAYSAPQEQRGGLLAQIAGIDPQGAASLEGQYQKRQERQDEAALGIARAWKASKGQPNRQALYDSVLAPRARAAGLPLPPAFDENAFDQQADALIAMAGPQSGAGVQSTYVDAAGNRVAILRNGSTAILGQDAPKNQIIDTGNGFYGVNKGNLQAAPVMLGGGQAQTQQPGIGPGTYNTPAGIVRIGDLTPDEQQAALADIQARGAASNVQLPTRDVSPQQRGGQLFSVPKPQAPPAGYRMNPDGSMSIIPGGPAQVQADARADAAAARRAAEEAKAEQKRQGESMRQSEAAASANQLISAIDTLTRSPGFDSLGTTWGDAQTGFPFIRNDAKDSKAQLENIAGQVALATMSRLKALSSQGATGFGALSEKELGLLQNSLATLQSGNISNAQLKASLKVIRDVMEKTANWRVPDSAPAAAAPAAQGRALRYNPATGDFD